MLYCLSSKNRSCSYQWSWFGANGRLEFPSTPVVYVNEGGLYQCEVDDNNDSLLSKLINVCLDGEYDIAFAVIYFKYLNCLPRCI